MLRLIREFFAAGRALRETRATLADAVEANSAGTRRIVARPAARPHKVYTLREAERLADLERRAKAAGAAE